MSTKKVELSGAATDVIHALFFRGALQDGELPSKDGAGELRALGFAETRHTETVFNGGDYFTFLTPAGTEYARQFLVETRFGASKATSHAMTLGINVDTTEAIRALDELDEHIRNSEAFKLLNKKTFIKDCLISKATISANKLFVASGVDANINDLIDNAVANAANYVTKDIQLAMLYRGENFVGFGVAVGGQLLAQQTDAEIKQHPAARDIAKLHTVFNLKKHQMENPVHIDLNTLR